MALDRRQLLSRGLLAAAGTALCAGSAAPAVARPRSPQPPRSPRSPRAGTARVPDGGPYPSVGEGTSFLDPSALLEGFSEQGWYEANIPFLDVPDDRIRDVYYYRWRTWKEHLVYTGAVHGWMLSEFLEPTSYGAPYGAINAAAGHHIDEGRWVRDRRYLDDYVDYWLHGPGAGPKPMTEHLNKDTSDWAHQYSFWVASAVWDRHLVTGDRTAATGQLAALIRQYDVWDNHFDDGLGLYWQVPVWDATEYTAASYESADPYHGGAGFRPTLNSYQYGDAKAIAAIAALAGDGAVRGDFTGRAARLKDATHRLWDPSRKFFTHMHRDDNPGRELLAHREIMGYLPWRFGLADARHADAWAQLTDPDGFAAPFGPTTLERRSRWFMHEADHCCRWDGPSWPYATAQTLGAMANLLHDQPAQGHVTAADYAALLRTYASTQVKDGRPYVAEAHHPDEDRWVYDGYNHSEDYNHSTFNDLVISGLIGLRPQRDDTVVVRPLVPAGWDWFALENVPYHGHNVTVLWDRTGSRYRQGPGMHVFVDGRSVARRAGLGPLTAQVGAPLEPPGGDGRADIAANPRSFAGLPAAFASYTFSRDHPQKVIDGSVIYDEVPQTTRWTNYQSPNASDTVGVDFHRPVAVDDVRLFFYDDGGGVRTPGEFDLQFWNGGGWAPVPGQTRSPAAPAGNTLNRITFPALRTSRLRVAAANPGPGVGWGLSGLQVWSLPVFHLVNGHSGKLLAVDGMSSADGAHVVQFADNGTADHLWQALDGGPGHVRLRNVHSGKVLGIDGMSTADSAHAVQYADNGTADHLWQLVEDGDGFQRLRNKHSGKVLGIDGMSTADSAHAVQFADNGTADHRWLLRPAS